MQDFDCVTYRVVNWCYRYDHMTQQDHRETLSLMYGASSHSQTSCYGILIVMYSHAYFLILTLKLAYFEGMYYIIVYIKAVIVNLDACCHELATLSSPWPSCNLLSVHCSQTVGYTLYIQLS